MNKVNRIVRSAVPLIGVVIGAVSLYKACQNDSKINSIEVRYLENTSRRYSKEFQIIRPEDKSDVVIRRDFIFDASYEEISFDYKFWIIGRHSGHYYFLGKNESLHIDKINKKVSRSGIRLSSPGEWEIMLCLVTNEADELLSKKNSLTNDRKFPSGVEILKTITVKGVYPN